MPSRLVSSGSAYERMTESGTASSKPNPRISGVVRAATVVTPAGRGSLSMPSAARSAGVTLSWKTGPPLSASWSQTNPIRSGWKSAACRSTSSPTPPVTGSSWHSPQPLALNSGPRPVAAVNVLSKMARPLSKRARSAGDRPPRGSPGFGGLQATAVTTSATRPMCRVMAWTSGRQPCCRRARLCRRRRVLRIRRIARGPHRRA